MSKMTRNRTLVSPQAVVLAIALVLPACEGFVCSQERIKAIELANSGADEFKNNLYDSAEKDLKQAIQTDPTYDIAYYNLGKVFQKQRKWDKAIESFEQAVAALAQERQLPVRPRRGLPRGKKIDQAEKALRRPRRPTEALQGVLAARPRAQGPQSPEGGRRRAPQRHRGQPALLEVVRRARLPLPRLRLQQGSGAGLPGLRHGQGRRRRVPQRLRARAQEPQAVRAGDDASSRRPSTSTPSSTTRSTTPAWRTPTGSTRRTATTRRTRPASTSRSSSPTAASRPTATTSRPPTTSSTRCRAPNPLRGRGRGFAPPTDPPRDLLRRTGAAKPRLSSFNALAALALAAQQNRGRSVGSLRSRGRLVGVSIPCSNTGSGLAPVAGASGGGIHPVLKHRVGARSGRGGAWWGVSIPCSNTGSREGARRVLGRHAPALRTARGTDTPTRRLWGSLRSLVERLQATS